MKRSLAMTICLLLPLSSIHAYTVNKLPPSWVVEDFSEYEVDAFPRKFRTYPFHRGKAREVYKVKLEGDNRFLHAHDDKDISVQILRSFVWDINRFPWASWRWRAKTLPVGGDERGAATNDSACGVYILFGQYSGEVLKYVWSSGAPKGTVVRKKPGRFHILVESSGHPVNADRWHRVVVNVADAYKREFGMEPKDPTGFGVLTDGNALHQGSSCDYDDFTISESR